MTTAPQWEAVDEPTVDLLSVLADPHPIVGTDATAAFLAACERDAAANDGLVSVNRVSAALADAGIEHHRYSACWSHFTGRGKPMRVANEGDTLQPWEIRHGSKSGNDGKPMRLRVWVGAR